MCVYCSGGYVDKLLGIFIGTSGVLNLAYHNIKNYSRLSLVPSILLGLEKTIWIPGPSACPV